MRPFLFLDVDGVLNTHESLLNGIELDDKCCRRLRRVIAEANPEIVLSSTWRLYPTHAKRVWRVVGYRCAATPDSMHGTRGTEIAAYLANFPKRPYVILDDNDDMLPEQLPFFVQTDPNEGLTDAKVDEIFKIFKGFEGID